MDVRDDTPVLTTGNKPTWQLVLTLAWPVLLQLTLVYLVTLSDALLAGRFQPTEGDHVAAQSALTTATYLTWLISGYTVLVTVGSIAMVARFVGAAETEQAVEVTNQSQLLAVLFGCIGAVFGLLFTPTLLRALQLSGESIQFAADYLRPLFIALPIQMLMQGGIACLVGAGDTRTGMWTLLLVAILNVPLSWAYFHGWGPFPAMSFTGIAMGTAVSHTVGGIAVMARLMRGHAGLKLHLPLLIPNLDLIRRLLRISIPAGIDSLILMTGQLWFLSIVNRLSTSEAAAHGIALRWEGISYLSGMAFGTAAMTLVGQNLGAKRPQEAARSAWTALAMACGAMSMMGVVFFLLAGPMFELFCPFAHQRDVISAGAPVLRLIAFGMPPLACTIVFTQALRGAGDTRVPVMFTVIGFFLIRAPLAIYFTSKVLQLPFVGEVQGWNLGLIGAWFAMLTDLIVRAIFFLWRFRSNRWQLIKV